MSTDNREDYLINILRLTNGTGSVKTTDISKYMGVAPASVTEMLKVLSREGLVNYEKYRGVSLTEKGIKDAKSLRRKHHIMERFLTDVLDVDPESAHGEAHAIEHALSDEAASKMCRLIGTKVDSDCDTCPNPCDDMIGVTAICRRIPDLSIGEKGKITHLSGEDPEMVKKLISMGLAPGKTIVLDSLESDSYILIMDDNVLAINGKMASCIFVEKILG